MHRIFDIGPAATILMVNRNEISANSLVNSEVGKESQKHFDVVESGDVKYKSILQISSTSNKVF